MSPCGVTWSTPAPVGVPLAPSSPVDPWSRPMSSASLSRRSLMKAAALAGGVAAFGLPQALWPSTAEAYAVPSKMDWWYQARFGMFIHFGSYSQLGQGEWAFDSQQWSKAAYQSQVTKKFNPTQFNAATI